MDDVVAVQGDLSELHGGVDTLRALYVTFRQIQESTGRDMSFKCGWRFTQADEKFEFKIPKVNKNE